MARVKTFINGGDLFPADLNGIQDAYEAQRAQLAGAYRAVQVVTGVYASSQGSPPGGGVGLFPDKGPGVYIVSHNLGQSVQGTALLNIDPAAWAVTGLTPKLRIAARVANNATLPGVTFNVGLYPVTYGSGAAFISVIAGTVVAGSQTGPITPVASSSAAATGADFAVPAAGMYTLGVQTGAYATNSAGVVTARLELHHV